MAKPPRGPDEADALANRAVARRLATPRTRGREPVTVRLRPETAQKLTAARGAVSSRTSDVPGLTGETVRYGP